MADLETISIGDPTTHTTYAEYNSGVPRYYVGGTAAANLFDDYEEGTFSGALADDTTGGNEATLGAAYFVYTKIGNTVLIKVSITNITTTSMTSGNNVYITGLPFATRNNTLFFQTGSAVGDNISSASGGIVPYAPKGSTYFQLLESDGSSIIVSDITSGTADIHISLTYVT